MKRISEDDKAFNVNAFFNLVFIPYIQDNNIGLTEDDLIRNAQYIINRIEDEKFYKAFEPSNVVARLNLVSNGGLQYDDGEKTYFTGLNDSVAIYYNNNMELYSEKNLDIGFNTVDSSSISTLPTIKDSVANAFVGVQDFSKWYFTGNGKALYDYLDQYLSKDEIKELSDICDEDININRFKEIMKYVGKEEYLRKQEVVEEIEVIEEEEKPSLSEQKKELLKEKKDVATSYQNQVRNQVRDLELNDLRAKTL